MASCTVSCQASHARRRARYGELSTSSCSAHPQTSSYQQMASSAPAGTASGQSSCTRAPASVIEQAAANRNPQHEKKMGKLEGDGKSGRLTAALRNVLSSAADFCARSNGAHTHREQPAAREHKRS